MIGSGYETEDGSANDSEGDSSGIDFLILVFTCNLLMILFDVLISLAFFFLWYTSSYNQPLVKMERSHLLILCAL